MGTYKLWELASTRAEVYELANQVITDMASRNEFPLQKGNWDEPSQTIVYAVWQAAWALPSKTPDSSHVPYTHRVEMSMSGLVREVFPGIEELYGKSTPRFSRTVYAILARSQLLKRVGETSGQGRGTHYIREWPEGFVPRYYATSEGAYFSKKDEADLARQAKKGRDLAGPVTTRFDLNALALPKEPTPEAILAFVQKLIPLAKSLQSERDALAKKVAELEAEREGKGWESVLEGIKAELTS